MIINSLTDTDFYKFTMAQLVLHQHADAMVEYHYKCRNGTGTPFKNDIAKSTEFVKQINEELDHLCSLRFKHKELEYLSKISFFKDDFIEYLRLFQLNRNYINCWIDNKSYLQIHVKGSWLSTIWFEVPVLAINSELLGKYAHLQSKTNNAIKTNRLQDKIKLLSNFLQTGGSGFKFADFGTRRRFSYIWHKKILETLIKQLPEGVFIGTSNVHFAMKYNIKPIGTMAHELFQAFQQLGPRLVDHQKVTLQAWVDEYRGELGIALSDIVGFDRFLNDFDLYFAKLFDGVRHDSGDPFIWARKLIHHYNKLNIDSKTKTAVFSDGLDFEKAIKIYSKFKNVINISFGIGTNLLNDTGVKAPQIVIKIVKCNGSPTAKISDSNGKCMCNDNGFLNYLKQVYQIK